MDQIRTFIAIELPEDVKQYLARIQNELKKACCSSIKWVNPDNIHLTLKFLGNIDKQQVEPVVNAIIESVNGFSIFNLEIAELGVFPDLKNVQVVWVGLNRDIQTLLELQKRLDANLHKIGFARENRAFKAHLTLARVSFNISDSDKQKFSRAISGYKLLTNLTFKVVDISLIKSQLTRSGPIYTRLNSIKIKSSCE